MTLTPKDIQAKQFHVRFRGFDVEEVDGFLEHIAENFLLLMEDNKTLNAQVNTLSSRLDSLKNEESSFKEAIISAQKVTEEMKKQSRAEADQLLAETREEVASLKGEAHDEITELEYQVDRLRGIESQLRAELHEVIDNYRALVDSNFKAEPASPGPVAAHQVYEPDAPEDEEIEDESDERPEERDLSDLYERMDLDSMEAAPEQSNSPEQSADSSDLPEQDLTEQVQEDLEPVENDNPAIPNLDDDIMFTLDDPLDSDDEPQK